MQKLDARFRLILAMVVFGTIGLFVRNIAVTSGELALYRAVLAALLIAGYLLCTRQSIPLKEIKHETPLLLFSGVAMGFNWIFLFQAYKYTTISLATLSYYFAPVIVTLVCPILFKEKLQSKQWLCFVMSTLGLVLITGIGDLSGGNSNLIGILCGLAAAGLYATVILINKFIKNVEGIHRTFLQFIAAVIVLLPYVYCTSGFSVSSLSLSGWIYLLIVGLFHTGITYCLYFSSIKELPGQKAAILSYIDPFVAVLLSVTMLGESMTMTQAIDYLPAVSGLAISFIIAGVIGASQKAILSTSGVIFAVVILHNCLGYALGFGLARLTGMSWKKAIALSVEVGMQNSGLATGLAKAHFAAMPTATVPGAIFSAWHNLSGALLAYIFESYLNPKYHPDYQNEKE